MGITTIYLEADDLMISVWHGVVSGAEWEQMVRRNLADDPLWPRGRRHLADLTTFDPAELTIEDVDTVAAIGREHIENFAGRRQAIVATLGWDLARNYERRALDGATTIVFTNVRDACAWLGIDPVRAGKIVAELRAEARAGG
jgi:hypothetical protein